MTAAPSSLHVLVFTQFFAPEIGATQTRLVEFARGLAARGHTVEVICEVPNHPQGRIHEGFRGRPLVRRRGNGFTAAHLWVYTTERKTTLTRLLFYGSYMGLATLVGSARRRPDVILASSPPLPVAMAGDLVARRHRVPWILDVRDLWPEAAVALGELTDERLLRLTGRIAESLYERSAAVTTVTEPFLQRIAGVVSRPEKVTLVPNGTTQFWVDGAELPGDRRELGLPEDRFLWTFAGNVGVAQGLEAAIDAAARLGEGHRLLILGDGPARAALEQRAQEVAPGLVEFRGQVAPEVARAYLRASDCLLVSLNAHPELAPFVPSKLFDCCAVGRPVVVAAAGEPPRLVEKAGAALAVPPGDPVALADAVARVRDDEGLRSELTERGRAFGRANLRDAAVARLADVVESVAAAR